MSSDSNKTVKRQRGAVILAVTLVAITLGAMAGHLLCRSIMVHLAETGLQQYSSRIMSDGEASSAELRTVLAAVSASPHPSCSDTDISYFRTLIFESEFLKDAGRMADGKILCSAALGRAPKMQSQSDPDFTQQDGTEVYRDLSAYQNSDLTIITLKLGNSFVAFTPLSRLHLEPAPMHYTETLIDAPTQKTGQLLGEQVLNNSPILTTEGLAHLGDSLYATRCSLRFYDCVTAFTTFPEIVQTHRVQFAGLIALGGIVGAFFSLAFFFLYRRNKSVEQQLRRAIRQDKLRMVYQPIVDLKSGHIVGAEALARWTNEEGVAVGPDVFIKVAEERGFVGEITRLVIRHALRDFGKTLRTHHGFHLSINIAASDLSDPEFLPMLKNMLKQEKVSARNLNIEITEGSTARHEIAIEAIHCLRERGHRVHIDDFGTGYSSLSYLHALSVDAIKIDKAFTQAIGTDSVIVAILPQILAMARALNLGVIVEGVETAQQANYFTRAKPLPCVQGWLYGRPTPPDQFHALLSEDEKKAHIVPEKAPERQQVEKASELLVPANVA